MWPAPDLAAPHIVQTSHPIMEWSVRTQHVDRMSSETNRRTFTEACDTWRKLDLSARCEQHRMALRYGPSRY